MKGGRVILPKQPQTLRAVASHYDALDSFYREIWGEHVHHGYWATGRESVTEAAVALVDLLAQRLRLEPGQRVCDIGCGYGATAHYLAEHHDLDVTGVDHLAGAGAPSPGADGGTRPFADPAAGLADQQLSGGQLRPCLRGGKFRAHAGQAALLQ